MDNKLIKTVGKIIGINWNEVDFDEFKIGLGLELKEHGDFDKQTNVIDNDIVKAGKIALAHLKEMPNYYTELQKMEMKNESLYNIQEPLNFKTISNNLIYKLGKQFGNDLVGYNLQDLKNGLLRELENMQTYTLQSLSSEKLVKSFSKALNNINNDPGYYNNKKSVAKYNVGALQEKFDFNKFKKLKPLQQSQFLYNLGKELHVSEGSSRAVFIMGKGKAIKLAINKAGLLQNKKEVEKYKKHQEFSYILPKIYDYDPEFHWLMVELVKPLSPNIEKDVFKGEKLFKKLTGMDFENYSDALVDYISNNFLLEKYKYNNFFMQVAQLIKSSGISVDDLMYANQYGVAADGRVVILDTGFDQEVKDKYYTDAAMLQGSSFELPSSYYKECMQLKNVYKTFLTEKKFFNIDDFKLLPPVKQILFLKQKGKVVGEGSSRRTYIIDSKSVLKLAKNEKGLAQNKTEVEMFNNPLSKKLVAEIYDYEPSFRWLVSEIARPIQSEEDFKDVAGFNWEEYASILENYMKYSKKGFDIDTDEVHNPLIGKVLDIILKGEMMSADLLKLDSWGKTADGRLVLIDYGYTVDVYDKHYKPRAKNKLGSQDPTAQKAETLSSNQDTKQIANK